ncbi:Ref family protein [Luteibacter aegosomatis]|uniref:Ref family recombination enhancement nuclease n=1 Tax=Luteibacter aegosomatis TaxID=2911537 RepID=UPI001FF77C21|nr:Ref family recombination enhancement nuclease [Luteibacter aegosomatis]UPG86834.1 Ref family protein [Luteibacter aegosomatis]
MKRTPIIRKTPLVARKQFAAMSAVRQALTVTKEKPKAVAIRPALKRGRSTGKPTKTESERIDRIKRGECVCCHLNHSLGRLRAAFQGCDAHHLLSGARRRGHTFTIGACPWHHRGVRPFGEMTDKEAADLYGPSLAHGSKPFHAFYGSDDDLLALQERLLEGAEMSGQAGDA